ncbi:MAG TPA: AAA family ATPase [Limnobacter sp.]|nr:AAA family ATPase [Limnobacter sp.]
MKQLWLLAGGNGAGKSTFYNTQLKPLGLPFINADLIARELFPEAPEAHSYDAAKIAETLRHNLLAQGKSFCFETVFSHPSKVDFVARAKALGYTVVLVYIHLSSTALNKARVAQRVAMGGHAVPEEKIESRVPRSIEQVQAALPLCDEAWLLDNSSADNPMLPVLHIEQGLRKPLCKPLPEWVKTWL